MCLFVYLLYELCDELEFRISVMWRRLTSVLPAYTDEAAAAATAAAALTTATNAAQASSVLEI